MFDLSIAWAVALKTGLLLVVVGLFAALMAKHSAARRHLVWTAALALTLVMPFAVVYMPASVQVPLPWQPPASWKFASTVRESA